MSYQRWGKPGRFYVWAGDAGLHIWPGGTDSDQNGGMVLTANAAGRDNAAAILRGCVDHLKSLGMKVTIKNGKCEIAKAK